MDIATINSLRGREAGALFERNHVVAMKQCSPVDSPSTGKKISFAGRSAVAGKSEKKTQRRIDSSRFFIPPPMTVKEETSDGLTSTTEQTPTTRQQEETKLILSPNLTIDHRRSMTNQTPNQDGHILGLGFLHTSRGPFASQESQFGKSNSCLRKLPCGMVR